MLASRSWTNQQGLSTWGKKNSILHHRLSPVTQKGMPDHQGEQQFLTKYCSTGHFSTLPGKFCFKYLHCKSNCFGDTR